MSYFNPHPPWALPANYGWVCPKCGRVYSPITPQCWSCSSFASVGGPIVPPEGSVISDNTEKL